LGRAVKVLLVDDHVLFRDGLSMLLKSMMQGVEVFEAGSVREGIAQVAAQGSMDLILLDLGLPDMVGTEAIGAMRDKYPDIPVVVLSSSEDKATVLSALDRGAMGFVPKTSKSAILPDAMRLILSRGIYLPPSVFIGDRQPAVAAATAEQSSRSSQGPPKKVTPEAMGLTPRQSQVLSLILQGKAAKEISRALNLSAGTVKTHTSAVLRALNVTTRTQAVVAASKLGLGF
jgi:DNA-binding NarL/FixJ family response regulator